MEMKEKIIGRLKSRYDAVMVGGAHSRAKMNKNETNHNYTTQIVCSTTIKHQPAFNSIAPYAFFSIYSYYSQVHRAINLIR